MASDRGKRSAAILFGVLFLCVPAVFADEPVRTWNDKSGKFQVEAKLQSHDADNVVLLKTDGRAVTVPRSLLSEADQKFLTELDSAMENPFAGGVPVTQGGASPAPSGSLDLLAQDAAVPELPTDGTAIYISIEEDLPPLKADPTPHTPKFSPFARPLEKIDAYARTSPPVLLDPQGPTFAVSVHRVGNAVKPDHFGRIYVANRRSNRPRVAIDLPETLLLWDHHITSGRTLAALGVDSPSERGGDLVLLEGITEGKPRVLCRWHLPAWDRPGFKPKVEFARVLDPETAVVQVNNTVYVWNLLKGEAIYLIDDVRSGAKLAISGGGHYLAVPTSKGCRVVDLQNGELLGNVPFPTSLVPEVHFSPNGTSLALVAGNQFSVWDLVEATMRHEGTISATSGDFVGWAGDQYLLTQLGGLIDPELAMSLWHYSLPSGGKALAMPGGVAAIDKSGVTTLLCLPVPHQPVAAVQKQLASGGDDLLLIRPGTEVSLKIDAVEGIDPEEMRTGLAKAVERAGWVVNEESPVRLTATITRGEEQELQFRTLGQSIQAPRQTATIKPYTASLEVRHGEQVLWSRRSTNMVPFILHMNQGETLQEAVKKFEKADPAFFARLTLPPKVLKPEVSKNVGRSMISEGRWRDF